MQDFMKLTKKYLGEIRREGVRGLKTGVGGIAAWDLDVGGRGLPDMPDRGRRRIFSPSPCHPNRYSQ